ncbi:hypothetical protein M408DRAFT_331181 [Serendipita vermifera MAFF 305830]|uniref:Uncharacterized protein n=1 Tax=Serendipita vermifera MAFF 305830 TaxID=933852 RepID=A0A0C3AZM2_SERVB|nr:hypothetical protein M408DRAFT_331181 [Serendipita vermifera MAFF 305830]
MGTTYIPHDSQPLPHNDTITNHQQDDNPLTPTCRRYHSTSRCLGVFPTHHESA